MIKNVCISTALFIYVVLVSSCASVNDVTELKERQDELEQKIDGLQGIYKNIGESIELIPYKQAKKYIEKFKESVTDSEENCLERCYLRGYNLQQSLAQAITVASSLPVYRQSERFYGVRIYYGIREGERSSIKKEGGERLGTIELEEPKPDVAVLVAMTAEGTAREPNDKDLVIVTTLDEGYTDPCPPLCDY